MIRVVLSDEAKKELEDFRIQAGSKDSEKALMVLLSNDKKTPEEIANNLKRHPHTVRFWLKRYQKKGIAGLTRKYSPGRPKEKREKVKIRIREIIECPPQSFGYMDSVWSVPLIAHDVENHLGEAVSHDTVTRALKDLGYSYKRPSKTTPEGKLSKKEKEKAFQSTLDEIKSLMDQKDCILYSLDESHFSTEPYLVRGWFKKR